MNVHGASGPQYKYQVRAWPALHLANFCRSRTLGLRCRKRLEHAAAYGVHPRSLHPRSMSSPRPLRPEHAIDLDRFTDTPDRALRRRPRPRALLDSVLPLPVGNPRGTCELL
jgi:hypothetical protein